MRYLVMVIYQRKKNNDIFLCIYNEISFVRFFHCWLLEFGSQVTRGGLRMILLRGGVDFYDSVYILYIDFLRVMYYKICKKNVRIPPTPPCFATPHCCFRIKYRTVRGGSRR